MTAIAASQIVVPARSRPFRNFLRRDTTLTMTLSLLAALIVATLLGPLVWRAQPDSINLGAVLQAPSLGHPMGTDDTGRDVLARVLAGGQTSILAGLTIALIGAVLGCIAALLAGSMRGWVDTLFTWLTNSILCFPAILLAMAIAMALKPGVTAVVIGLSLHSFPWYMRTLRGEVMRLYGQDFIRSTMALGAHPARVLFRHVFPHLVPIMILQMAAVFGAAVLSLAALGYLGLGAQPPTAEWGEMITDGQQFFLTGQWWIAGFPGLGLLLAVSLTTLIADRAREVLDPRGEFVQAK
ncbi:ABC transporter permease [Arthrobacter sp. AZCC_0090]|uniref:ABC transporter permease n=1 Tax=Arthrobacter sp. AZCC_0090 TaxID=2735881 RepID=UPI00160F0626|nr:ABC transporter permease [Arthrobacter sp. AZCC_0090]MBB6405833.1 peptide/nickel transport system permease protein [Arthrobacter sp. AZCC_0090]